MTAQLLFACDMIDDAMPADDDYSADGSPPRVTVVIGHRLKFLAKGTKWSLVANGRQSGD